MARRNKRPNLASLDEAARRYPGLADPDVRARLQAGMPESVNFLLNTTAASVISGADDALQESTEGKAPTQQELAAWIGSGACPPEAMREVADRLAVLWGVEPGKVTVTGWAYGGLTTWRDGEEWHAPARDLVDEQQRLKVLNPLAPLMRAWQRGPVEGRPNLRPDRIIPGKLAMVDPSHVRADRMMRLFSASAHREGQLAMPGFGETDYDGPALPLALYGLGDTNLQHGGGRGAPLALRLFVEAVLAVRLEDRGKNKPIAHGRPAPRAPGESVSGAAQAAPDRILAPTHAGRGGPGRDGRPHSVG